METVDIYDGTVVVLWENNRDLATVTAVKTDMGIQALAGALILAGLAVMIAYRMKHTER